MIFLLIFLFNNLVVQTLNYTLIVITIILYYYVLIHLTRIHPYIPIVTLSVSLCNFLFTWKSKNNQKLAYGDTRCVYLFRYFCNYLTPPNISILRSSVWHIIFLNSPRIKDFVCVFYIFFRLIMNTKFKSLYNLNTRIKMLMMLKIVYKNFRFWNNYLKNLSINN